MNYITSNKFALDGFNLLTGIQDLNRMWVVLIFSITFTLLHCLLIQLQICFSINSQDMILESTKPSNKTGSNHIITVMFTEDSNSSSSNVTKDTSQFTVTESATTCKVSTLFDSSKKTNLNHLKASASSNCTSFSTISYPLQQTNCAVAYIQAKPFSSVKHSLDDHHLMPQTINASNSSMKNNKENNFIASVGAMYFPDDPHLDSSANEDVAPTRPNLLFSVDGESKALVGNHLLTPGKALQQNSSLSTPHGRNLAALSPDTIDCVLNDEFQNHSDFKEQEITKSLSSSRPASYPSLTSADLDVLNSYDDPYQVSDSCTYRSNSFTHGCVHRKSAPDSHDSAISSNTTSSHQTVTFSQEDLRLDKKLNTASSFEFSPASFLRSIDEHISYPSSSVCTNTQSDQNNGGLFLPNLDISVLSQPHASSVSSNDVTGILHELTINCVSYLLNYIRKLIYLKKIIKITKACVHGINLLNNFSQITQLVLFQS